MGGGGAIIRGGGGGGGGGRHTAGRGGASAPNADATGICGLGLAHDTKQRW